MAFRYGLQQWTRQLTKKQPEIIQLAADKEIAQTLSVGGFHSICAGLGCVIAR